MTEASVSVESRAAGGGDLCSSSFGVRMGCMEGRISWRVRPAQFVGAGGISSERRKSWQPANCASNWRPCVTVPKAG